MSQQLYIESSTFLSIRFERADISVYADIGNQALASGTCACTGFMGPGLGSVCLDVMKAALV